MRILRQRLGAVCMFLMLVLAVSACDQTTSLEPERPSFKAHLHPSLNNTDEGDALVKAAELLARSLEDDAVRQAVKNHMRASPYNEHKLEFRSYLVSQDGGPLLAAMAREYAAETADVLALLARIRPLELYMPVVEHRLTWTGDPDVVVAGLLEDHTIPAGFTVTGEFHQFTSAEEAPDVPTLSLVPVETNFSRVPDRGAFRNVDQAAGEAIGVWEPLSVKKSEDDCGPYAIRECDSGGTSGGGIDWSIRPTGLWMTKAYIPDDHEGGFKGAPEFETHLQSPLHDPSVAEDRWCSGEGETEVSNEWSVYNQDNETWSGAVMVSDSATQEEFRQEFGIDDIGQAMINWEDDDTKCEIKADEDRFRNMIESIAIAYDPVTAAVQHPDSANVVKALPVAKDALFAMASWLKSNDDVVGGWIKQFCEMPDGSFGNWTIKDGTTTKGCVMLKAHDQSSY